MTGERDAEQQRILAEIEPFVTQLATLYDDELIPTGWVLVVAASSIEWADGRESIGIHHPNVPWSRRLGLLTAAQHDVEHVTEIVTLKDLRDR